MAAIAGTSEAGGLSIPFPCGLACGQLPNSALASMGTAAHLCHPLVLVPLQIGLQYLCGQREVPGPPGRADPSGDIIFKRLPLRSNVASGRLRRASVTFVLPAVLQEQKKCFMYLWVTTTVSKFKSKNLTVQCN